MSSGIDSTTATAREISASSQRPVTAAVSPSVMPMAKDSRVVTKAMPIVMRAP